MKTTELRELTAEQLEAKLAETRKELATLRLRHASKVEIEKPARIRTLRRDIARMLTVRNAAMKEAK